jgi:hypothetical protein
MLASNFLLPILYPSGTVLFVSAVYERNKVAFGLTQLHRRILKVRSANYPRICIFDKS